MTLAVNKILLRHCTLICKRVKNYCINTYYIYKSDLNCFFVKFLNNVPHWRRKTSFFFVFASGCRTRLWLRSFSGLISPLSPWSFQRKASAVKRLSLFVFWLKIIENSCLKAIKVAINSTSQWYLNLKTVLNHQWL